IAHIEAAALEDSPGRTAGAVQFADLLQPAGDDRRALLADAQAIVDGVDDMGERHGDDEIEDARQKQRRKVAGDDGLILSHTENLALGGKQAEEIDEARILDITDELIDEGRQYAAHALRHDDEPHALAI